MAVVVWVFAGGGDSEVRGLIPFLEKTFPGCIFKRKTPIRNRNKPGPKPNKKSSYGRTGQSLISQIGEELPIALKGKERCNLILVFDDLDCRDHQKQKKQTEEILQEILKNSEAAEIQKFVGFAAPEIEAWIIADWDNSIAKHSDFRGRHQDMKWWLISTEKKIPFDRPESFSEYDTEKKSCKEKLSDLISESAIKFGENIERHPRFSKKQHTPELFQKIDPNVVQKKCPLFRELYNYLNRFCGP